MPDSVIPLTLFIADDQEVVREGLRRLAEREGLNTIGEAENGRMLVSEVLRLKPSIVITDMGMPDLNGIEATRQLRAKEYRGAIIMFSQYEDRRHVSEAIDAGANAYVLKNYAFKQMMEAITAALNGQKWLSPQLGNILVKGRVPDFLSPLTPREREVFQLLGEGHHTKEVASRLGVNHKTVEAHRVSLMAKLKIGSPSAIPCIAVREGVVKLNPPPAANIYSKV